MKSFTMPPSAAGPRAALRLHARVASVLRRVGVVAGAAVLALAPLPGAAAGWQPTKPVTFVVVGGPGGGADQIARLIQGISSKYQLMKEPLVVVVENGGGGAQGLLDIKDSAGDPHKIAIALSNLYTIPFATGLPFNWRDTTPVALLALDQFVLWVNADTPYKTTQEFIAAVKAGGPRAFKMGVVGSKREDEIVTAMLEQATGATFVHIPYKGGGENATQLVGKHIDANVNNPIENIAQWRAGQVRPLCVFDHDRMPFNQPLANGQSWHDIPTCRDAGADVRYLMLRGIFMPKGVTPEQRDFYVDLLKKVRDKPEWREFIDRGAYKDAFMSGGEFEQFLVDDERRHRDIMQKAGFLAKP
jgi:putative tricarboxylic transport membrane protein